MTEVSISVAAQPAGNGSCTVVSVAGEADVTTPQLGDVLAEEAARKPPLLLVEMSGLTGIDQSSLAAVVSGVAPGPRHQGAGLQQSDPVLVRLLATLVTLDPGACRHVGFSLERSEQLMSGPAKRDLIRPVAPTGPGGDRVAEVYDRHAPAVFRQALLMLDDDGLAEQVAGDVLTAECALPAVPADDADLMSRRLAASTLRRCQELTADPAREGHASRRRTGCTCPAVEGIGSGQRALLGLVLFGGMGYREAARELAISPSRAAVMLRDALIAQRVSSEDLRAPQPGVRTAD